NRSFCGPGRAAIATGPLVSRLNSMASATPVLRNSRSHRARTTCGIISGGVVSMLEAIETHCSETLCLSFWICPFVSASLGGISGREVFRAILILLVSGHRLSVVGLLDHLIRPSQERRRNRQPERLGGLEVD